jgi:leucyl-tRNA synthetase
MELFGENFERYQPDEPDADIDTTSFPNGPGASDKAKKGKVAAKATGHKYQFQIMESIGVPRKEIKKFADPQFWLEYFPPIAQV